MITAIIFTAHLVFSLLIFTKKWQDENISSALLNIGLIGILFSVGWSVTGMLAKLIMSNKGMGIYFDRDAFSLTILTAAEYFFYRVYYSDIFTEDGKETQ